jgi:hypothetical protein
MPGSPFRYKVSPPREDTLFHPSTFWLTPDWESSSTREHDGYIREELLYVGDFDEVNIHLFPRVRTVRVRSVDLDAATLSSFGVRCTPGKSAWIFVSRSRREEVEAFRPTVFTFKADSFVWVRNGEYVSREPQHEISSETIGMPEALSRWNVEPCYVDDLDALIDRLRAAGIYFDVQS